MNAIPGISQVEGKLITIQGKPALLDSDVAVLYGVETKHVNQAVRNNPDKFPSGYLVAIKKDEWANLKSKISTSNWSEEDEQERDNLKSKILTSSWGGKNKLPNAFTEKGLYMLSTILKSPRATQTTLAIVETFAKIRELSRTVAKLSDTKEKSKQQTLMQKSGEIMTDILGNDMQTTGTETSVELNLAVLKFKHTVKRKTE
jgi:hypothetical protein